MGFNSFSANQFGRQQQQKRNPISLEIHPTPNEIGGLLNSSNASLFEIVEFLFNQTNVFDFRKPVQHSVLLRCSEITKQKPNEATRSDVETNKSIRQGKSGKSKLTAVKNKNIKSDG